MGDGLAICAPCCVVLKSTVPLARFVLGAYPMTFRLTHTIAHYPVVRVTIGARVHVPQHGFILPRVLVKNESVTIDLDGPVFELSLHVEQE